MYHNRRYRSILKKRKSIYIYIYIFGYVYFKFGDMNQILVLFFLNDCYYFPNFSTINLKTIEIIHYAI
jgi:hypothetical protein